MGENLENKKKLTSIRIMNGACMNTMNILDNVSICKDSGPMDSMFSE